MTADTAEESTMEIILQQDVDNLGTVGEIVRVRDGYARNYLIPRGLAVVADSRNVRALEHEKRVVAIKVERARKVAEKEAEKLSALEVVVAARVGSEGKLFGSVTSQDVQRELEKQGVVVDRKKIHLARPLKTLGDHPIEVGVGAGLKTTVTVRVVADESAPPAPEPELPVEEPREPEPAEAEGGEAESGEGGSKGE